MEKEKAQNLDESGGTEPASPGDEFEPTAEMMVNDFDDEHTLDEEEALEEPDEQRNELSNLEKEKDMPLEALLAMYGYNEEGEGEEEGEEGDENEEGEDAENTEDTEDIENKPRADDTNVPLSRAPRVVDENEMPEKIVNTENEEIENNEEMEDVPVTVDAEENAEDLNNEQFEEEEEFIEEDRGHPQSLLSELYKEHPGSGVGARQLRSGSRPQSEDEEEEDDGDYSPEEDDWKKTIMVGSDYQAQIPDGMKKYSEVPPYEQEDKLLWDPAQCTSDDVHNFLESVKKQNSSGPDRIPMGAHIRDDEQALFLLMDCNYDFEEALRRNKRTRTGHAAFKVAPMSTWSEEECRNFENGLRIYGKDFFLIHQHKLPTRPVAELVQFYYLWKKTERHDVFANKSKLEKKKYTLHPGTTYLEYRDFMEKFLDEQDSSGVAGAAAANSHVHSLLSSDSKRRASPLPMLNHHNHQMDSDAITPDEVRILKTHVEDLARHLSPQELESLIHLTAATRGIPNGGQTVNHSEGGGNPEIDSVSGISAIQSDNKMQSIAQ